MNELLNYLKENNYQYEVEYNGVIGLYEVTIRKGNKGIIRHYPYNIENIVSIKDLIEDIESEFND